MLSLTRGATKRVNTPFIRSFAEVVAPRSQGSASSLSSLQARHNLPKDAWQHGQIPVREGHGLYAFFRRKEGKDLEGEVKYETVETPEQSRVVSGRAWRTSELRLKSFADLHTLWYVSLRERNLLATQKEEARRMGVQSFVISGLAIKAGACRKTMARIKAVMNERRLAYEGAIDLVEENMETVQDRQLLKMQLTIANKAYNKLEAFRTKTRIERKEKRRLSAEARKLARESLQTPESSDSVAATKATNAPQPTIELDTSEAPPETSAASSPVALQPTPNAESSATLTTPDATPPIQPNIAAQTTSAGLFGQPQKISANKE